MIPRGLFGRSQKLERSKVKKAQLNEKSYWRHTAASTSQRYKRLPALEQKGDLMHTLSSCVLWMTTTKENPTLCLSYKLFDRWVHRPVTVHIENWTCNQKEEDNDELVSYTGDISSKNFRLIDRLMSYLIPQLEKLTIDITWHPALHNPKLNVQNLNAVTIHTTLEGVEFICSDGTTASIDLNLKDAALQLVTGNRQASCCHNQRTFTVSSLSDAIKILEMTMKTGIHQISDQLSPRKQSFVLHTIQKLDVTKDTQENEQALQQILSSMSPQSSFKSSSCPVSCLWIQYGLVPCLLSLLLDPTKHHAHVLFQNIKNVCKALLIYKQELASKAIILYICRALQQYGLQCRRVLVLLSTLIDIPVFRKIAIEQFDLGQNFGRLLLVHGPYTQAEMTSLEQRGFHVEHQISVPPIYIINEQLQLPVTATSVWRVPPLPMRRNPPEQPLAQISILKNLLLLSPLNNDEVGFRNGHLTAMLLAFLDRGLMEKIQEPIDLHPISGQEMDSCQFFVMRLVLANVHEHTYMHPMRATFTDVPRLMVSKAKIDIRPIDAFVRQVMEMLPTAEDDVTIRMGFRLLTDLVTSTPSPTVADITSRHLTCCLPCIRTAPISSEFESDVKDSIQLTVFGLMEALLRRTRPFSAELLNRFVRSGIVGNVFKTLEMVQERRDLQCIKEEDASLWLQRCWKLLEALVGAGRSLVILPSSSTEIQALTDLEDQLAQDFIDSCNCHIASGISVLACCKFLAVYLDASQCRLYMQPAFPKLLKWLKETLNGAWNRRDMALVVEALNVVASVCSHVSDSDMPIVQSFVEGLLITLDWISADDLIQDQYAESDRTVPLMLSPQSDWMRSGSVKTQSLRSGQTKKESEIQPDCDDSSSESLSSVSRSLFLRPPRHSCVMSSLKSFPLEVPRSSTEVETIHRLEKFRSRHHLDIEKPVIDRSGAQGIPKLNLGLLAFARDNIQGRQSVASTVYSSEYPIRPLSEISDQSGMLEGQRLGSLFSGESDLMPVRSARETTVFKSDLYTDASASEGHDATKDAFGSELPSLIENPDVRRIKCTDHGDQWSPSSRGSTESERMLVNTFNVLPNPPSNEECDETRVTVRRSGSGSASLHKIHSFDKRRPSLAMKHLVGNLSSDVDHPLGQWGNSSIPTIVFAGRESDDLPKIESLSVGEDEDLLGSATTIDMAFETESRELELEMMFQDQEITSHSSIMIKSSQSSEYRLTQCDVVLEHPAVHAAVLKTLLRFITADYRSDKREKTLTKVIALGLHRHLHHISTPVLMSLRDWAIQHHDRDYYTLLKMLAKQLFDDKQYPSLKRIGRGVFSSIHECSCPIIGGPSLCCVKVIDLPTDPYGMRSTRDLFVELTILQHLQRLPHVVRLYDYGKSEDNLYMVMKLYAMDLLTWRRQMVGSIQESGKMMFVIFLEILKNIEALHASGFVHFDLKCSNILLESYDETGRGLYDWKDGESLPFGLILADFGEAMSIEAASCGLQRSRGTQAFMSPEMLISGGTTKRLSPGVQSDIWSLGCLLFELITGDVLFDDSDYSEFHTRLTKSHRSLIDPWKIQLIPETIREPVLMCLSYLLVRNPALRAPLHAVAEWVEHLLKTDVLPLPGHITISELDSLLPSARNSQSLENADPSSESTEFHPGRERAPLSPDVCILEYASAKDSWSLAAHRITHVVYIHLANGHEAELKKLRNATLRANGLMFEVQVSTEINESMSWTEHCRRCCTCVLMSCRMESRIAIVASKNVGQYVRLISRYLTQHDRHLNLDLGLLM